jgi:formylglycine-generating enzyme required for sulfatase activity
MKLLQWRWAMGVGLVVLVLMLALLIWIETHRGLGLKPGSSFTECPNCPEMVVVPAGKFMMGTPEDRPAPDSQRPQHEVTISKPFAIGKYEVTYAEWDACVAAGGCPNAADEGWGRGRLPVSHVSWTDAERYVTWLSKLTGKTYRLPSEAEWEYAARAGTTTLYSFGDNEAAAFSLYAWYERDSDGKTHPVGEKKPNGFGLYDMHGNVWEWVQDCHQSSYQGAPTDGSAWTTGDCASRVIRGGSYSSTTGRFRSDSRDAAPIVDGGRSLGFRVATTLAS